MGKPETIQERARRDRNKILDNIAKCEKELLLCLPTDPFRTVYEDAKKANLAAVHALDYVIQSESEEEIVPKPFRDLTARVLNRIMGKK